MTLKRKDIEKRFNVSGRTVRRWTGRGLVIEACETLADVEAWLDAQGLTGGAGRPPEHGGAPIQMAPKKRKRERIGIAEACARFATTAPTLARWRKLGAPFVKEGGRVWLDVGELEAWLAAREGSSDSKRAAPAAGDDDDASRPVGERLALAKLKKERALAAKHEFDVARRRGQYLERAAVEEMLGELGALVRQGLMGWPGRYASRWSGIVEAREMGRELEAAVVELLDQFARAADVEGAVDAA
jgi:phage terminase Nu1 subunit (DNA packaging protein)